MKKILINSFILSLLTITILSCGPSKAEMEAKEKQGFEWIDGGWIKSSDKGDIPYADIEIRVIDSCEYILWTSEHSYEQNGICHKGNCKNPIHRENKNNNSIFNN